jgi:hypothetical protein
MVRCSIPSPRVAIGGRPLRRGAPLAGAVACRARARLVGYHTMADDLIDIADDGTNDYAEKERPDGSKFTPSMHVPSARAFASTSGSGF